MKDFTTQTGIKLTNTISKEDLVIFIDNLLEIDKYEYTSCNQDKSIDEVYKHIQEQDYWMVKDADGMPALLFGVTPDDSDKHSITFLTSKYFSKRVTYNFLKYAGKMSKEWLSQYPYIWTICHKRASHHFKFLKYFGFKSSKLDGEWLYIVKQKD